MTSALHRRLRRLEHAKTAGEVRVVIQPAGLEGDALAEWRRVNLPASRDSGLTIVIRRFSDREPPRNSDD